MSEVESTKSIPNSNNLSIKDLNQNIPIIPNQQSIKMDVLQFKDEVLKEIKLLKKIMTDKYESNTTLISEKLKSYDNKFISINDRIVELS